MDFANEEDTTFGGVDESTAWGVAEVQNAWNIDPEQSGWTEVVTKTTADNKGLPRNTTVSETETVAAVEAAAQAKLPPDEVTAAKVSADEAAVAAEAKRLAEEKAAAAEAARVAAIKHAKRAAEEVEARRLAEEQAAAATAARAAAKEHEVKRPAKIGGSALGADASSVDISGWRLSEKDRQGYTECFHKLVKNGSSLVRA